MDPTDGVMVAAVSVSGTIAQTLGSPRFVGSTGLSGIWKHILLPKWKNKHRCVTVCAVPSRVGANNQVSQPKRVHTGSGGWNLAISFNNIKN